MKAATTTLLLMTIVVVYVMFNAFLVVHSIEAKRTQQRQLDSLIEVTKHDTVIHLYRVYGSDMYEIEFKEQVELMRKNRK